MFSLGYINKFYRLVKIFLNNSFNFIKCYIKELSTLIDHIKLFVFKSLVQSCFQSRSVIRENHGVNIKIERNRSVAQFVNSFLRV